MDMYQSKSFDTLPFLIDNLLDAYDSFSKDESKFKRNSHVKS